MSAEHGAAAAGDKQPEAPMPIGQFGQFLKDHGIETTREPDSVGVETIERLPLADRYGKPSSASLEVIAQSRKRENNNGYSTFSIHFRVHHNGGCLARSGSEYTENTLLASYH